ncbi:MAG: cytochrome P450 [Candidatus Latescibacteria bacterium]|nr:cytochrome P450 [Candidatus Latescibacterota bacterium]
MKPFNPKDPAFHADPCTFLRPYREQDPVHWSDVYDKWVLTRYDDVELMLKDKRFGRGAEFHRIATESGQPLMPAEKMRRNWFIFRDPPDHTRLRALLNRAFTPRLVKNLGATTQKITDDLLDRVQQDGQMELMADLAYPLPVTVIAIMLGVPLADRDLFWQYASDLASVVELKRSEEDIARANTFALEMTDYFRDLIAAKRQDPQNDLISQLIALEAEGDHLSEDELLGTCSMLLFAGHETTANLIGNGLLDLLLNPDQLGLLKARPELMPSAVTELLRYSISVAAVSRVALEDVQIDDVTIRAGQNVMGGLVSANRDPAHFRDPDKLDITRQPNRPLSFGHGIHYCLGAPLAQLETQIAIETILKRMPDLKLKSNQPEWRPSLAIRGLKTLPLTF